MPTGNPKWLTSPRESVDSPPDVRLCGLIWCAITAIFRSRTALQAEILILRHQLNVLRRKSSKRVALSSVDRLVFVGLYRLAPKVLEALTILRPQTVSVGIARISEHIGVGNQDGAWAGQRFPRAFAKLILEMSGANPLWGEPTDSR